MTPGDVIASLRVALEQHEARIGELEVEIASFRVTLEEQVAVNIKLQAEWDEAVDLLNKMSDAPVWWRARREFLARIGSRS